MKWEMTPGPHNVKPIGIVFSVDRDVINFKSLKQTLTVVVILIAQLTWQVDLTLIMN